MPAWGGKGEDLDVPGGMPPEAPALPLFVASVDGLLGVEATATLKRLASRMATKWKQPYSKTCGYIKSRISITLVRATNRCTLIRCAGTRDPRMQRLVARTKAIEILLLMYPHVFE